MGMCAPAWWAFKCVGEHVHTWVGVHAPLPVCPERRAGWACSCFPLSQPLNLCVFGVAKERPALPTLGGSAGQTH